MSDADLLSAIAKHVVIATAPPGHATDLGPGAERQRDEALAREVAAVAPPLLPPAGETESERQALDALDESLREARRRAQSGPYDAWEALNG